MLGTGPDHHQIGQRDRHHPFAGGAVPARGAFEQQDEASQLCALVVAPPPGGKVLVELAEISA